MSIPRRIRQLSLVLVTTFLLLEGLFQAAALVVWWTGSGRPAPPATTGGEEVVVCVGDSFTHGIGANRPDGNYPSQLERALKTQLPARNWRVANCGGSGQNSWDVLRRLDRQLQDHKPRWLCVIVGVNDRWSQPEAHELPVDAPAAADGFRWELRTLRCARLLKLFFTILWSGQQSQAPASQPDAPASGAAPASQKDVVAHAWKMLASGAFEETTEAFERAIAHSPEDEALRSWLVSLYMRTGRQPKALEQLRWLEQRHHDRPTQWSADAWVAALRHCGRNQEALAVVTRLAAEFPESTGLQVALGVLNAEVGDRNAVRAPLTRAIELSNQHEAPGMRAWRYWERARLLTQGEPETALSDILTCHGLDPTMPERTKRLLVFGRSLFTWEMFDQALAAVGPDPAVAQEVGKLFEQVRGPRLLATQPAGAVPAQPVAADATGTPRPTSAAGASPLAAHLRQIVARAQRAGARVVIGGYPCDYAENDTLRAIARELGCGSVDVWPAIREALKTHPRREIYAEDDAHCADAGYAIMATLMAGEIARMASSQ